MDVRDEFFRLVEYVLLLDKDGVQRLRIGHI